MPIYQEGLSDFRVGAMRQKMQMGVSQKVPSPLAGEGRPLPHPSPIEGEGNFRENQQEKWPG